MVQQTYCSSGGLVSMGSALERRTDGATRVILSRRELSRERISSFPHPPLVATTMFTHSGTLGTLGDIFLALVQGVSFQSDECLVLQITSAESNLASKFQTFKKSTNSILEELCTGLYVPYEFSAVIYYAPQQQIHVFVKFKRTVTAVIVFVILMVNSGSSPQITRRQINRIFFQRVFTARISARYCSYKEFRERAYNRIKMAGNIQFNQNAMTHLGILLTNQVSTN